MLFRRQIVLVAAAVSIAAGAGLGQERKPGVLVGEEKRTRDEIDIADRLAADRRYDDAVKRYQQILAESGDALVSLGPAEPRRALPARWIVHQRIAGLPPEGRKLFRAAVEDTARKWFDEGAARRDVRLLEQVVSEAFCSESAEKALHLLGDLAMERGEFELAEHYWHMLARYPSEQARKSGPDPQPFALLHPDIKGDPAFAPAKLILALIFRGEKDTAKVELEHFRQQFSGTQGALAGRRGDYAATLQALLGADTRFAAGAAANDTSWPTFAGAAGRNRPIAADASPYWPDSPTWQAPLPGDPKAIPHRESDAPLGTGPPARALAFHPVIVPGFALVADAARVFVYRLSDGTLAATYDHRDNAGLPASMDLRVPPHGDAAYTLSFVGDRVYARFGAQPMKAPDSDKPAEQESVIACLTLQRDGDGTVKLQLRWQIRARVLDNEPAAIFEGAPIVRDGRLYIARTRFEGRQTIATVECYDADSADARGEPPARRWRQEVWSVEAGTDPPRQRHDLLTLAGPNVVYCTHSGAIVALDAASGRRAWAYRYPVANGRAADGVLPHDLCPCLYAGGRIYAAPADSDRILCLDARSGERVWESNATHVVQLLGVSGGRLFATLGGFPQGLRAYGAARGDVLWTRPDEGDCATFGRGLLSDRFVFWPTRSGLRVLWQENGERADAGSSDRPWGHIAVGEGYVIVTTPTEIWGFVPPREQLGYWQRQTAERPADADARYHLALAEADAGAAESAAADFHRAAELAGAGERLHGRPLRELAEHRRHELLLARAAHLWQRDQKEEARDILRLASDEPFALADRVRAWALRRAAGDAGQPDLADRPELRSLWVTRPDGLPQRADEFLRGVKTEANARPAERPPAPLRPPDIPLPLVISASATIDRFREWPLAPFRDAAMDQGGPPADAEGRLFLGGSHRVSCRSLESGKTLWAKDLLHDAAECSFLGDSVIVAGSDGASRLQRADGQIMWQFLAPETEPMPAAFPATPFLRRELWPSARLLSVFQLAGGRLFARWGPQHLLAFDAQSGRPLWQFRSPGAVARTAAEGAGLSEHFLATPGQLLVQTTGGELLALGAADGRLLYRRAAPVPWTGPPLTIDEARAVYAEGPRLHAIDLATGAERWSAMPRGESSLSGAAPQLRRDGSRLLVLTERNYGYDLERLALDDGRPAGEPIFLGRDRVNLSRSALTPEVFALQAGGRVIALDRATGREQWALALPRAGREPWRVRATAGALLIHPEQALPRADLDALADRAAGELAGVPTSGRIQFALNMLYHGWLRRAFPVLAVAPADGRKLQELSVSAEGPRAELLLAVRAAVIVEGRMDLLKTN